MVWKIEGFAVEDEEEEETDTTAMGGGIDRDDALPNVAGRTDGIVSGTPLGGIRTTVLNRVL